MTTEAGAASRSSVLLRPWIVTFARLVASVPVTSIVPLALSKPPVTLRSALVLSVPVLTREPSTVIALLASSVPLLTNVPPSLTSRPTLSVRLESLLLSLPEVLSSVPLLIVILSLPLPVLIVTLPEAFVKSLLKVLAQSSSQVFSSLMVLGTVLAPVPTVSVTSCSPLAAMAPVEKTASVVRTAATSGFLEKVALLIDLSFV